MSINIENINYSEFKNICRVCMFNCDVKFYLDCVVSSIFHKLTDLHFETNNDLPQQICGKCFEKINEIQEFIFKCKQTHDTLMECLNNFKQVQIKQEEYSNAGPENTNITKKCQFEINLEKPVTNEVKNNLANNINVIVEINKNIEMDEGLIPEASEIKEEVLENTDLQDTSYNIKEEIAIEEHQIEFVKSEHVFDETSEINNEQNKIESDEDLFASNSLNVNSGSDEDPDYNYSSSDDSDLNNENLDVFNEKLGFSNIISKRNEEDSNFKCDQCPKTFNNSANMRKHMRTHSGERPYKCDQCSKSFFKCSNLKDHIRSHSGERPFKCDMCLKSFKRSSYLKTHMLTHSGERSFKCDQCSKSFNRKFILDTHMYTHSDERPFKCDQCSKSFTLLSSLKKHILTHSGERPFKCDQCSKSFKQQYYMKRHMLTHTDERPFKCDQCSKSFNRLNHMERHMLTHTGERPFKCDQCPKSFFRLDHVKKHMRTHTRERPLKCDQCSISFKRKDDMEVHMRTAHQQD